MGFASCAWTPSRCPALACGGFQGASANRPSGAVVQSAGAPEMHGHARRAGAWWWVGSQRVCARRRGLLSAKTVRSELTVGLRSQFDFACMKVGLRGQKLICLLAEGQLQIFANLQPQLYAGLESPSQAASQRGMEWNSYVIAFPMSSSNNETSNVVLRTYFKVELGC